MSMDRDMDRSIEAEQMTKLEELKAALDASHAAAYKMPYADRTDDAIEQHFAAARAYRAEWEKKKNE